MAKTLRATTLPYYSTEETFNRWGIDFNATDLYLAKFLRQCALQLLGTVAFLGKIGETILSKPAYAAAWKLAKAFFVDPF